MQMMQNSLANKCNKLCFRHEKVIMCNLEGVLQFHQKGVYLLQLHLLLQALVFEYTERQKH